MAAVGRIPSELRELTFELIHSSLEIVFSSLRDVEGSAQIGGLVYRVDVLCVDGLVAVTSTVGFLLKLTHAALVEVVDDLEFADASFEGRVGRLKVFVALRGLKMPIARPLCVASAKRHS